MNLKKLLVVIVAVGAILVASPLDELLGLHLLTRSIKRG